MMIDVDDDDVEYEYYHAWNHWVNMFVVLNECWPELLLLIGKMFEKYSNLFERIDHVYSMDLVE